MPIFVSTAQVSDKGEVSLRCEEGEKTHAYFDTRGFLSIGVGHSIYSPNYEHFTASTVWTQTVIDQVFKLDLKTFVDALNRDLKVPVDQHQFDALVSLEYNIGMGGLHGSHLLQVINGHGADAVTENDFLAWAHPSELKGRRLREWAMYSRGIYRTA